MRVLLLSTIHPPSDTRIVLKIAPALAKKYEVFCCLPEATVENNPENIKMIALPHFRSLALRILICHPILIFKCILLRPKVVHVFVPELIPIALLFQWLGAKIIYEVQENLIKKFEIKTYNNEIVFKKLWIFFDKIAEEQFYFVFTEHTYPKYYKNLKKPFEVVHNYVSIKLVDQYYSLKSKIVPPIFFYCGIISKERSFEVMIQAFIILKSKIPEFKVNLFGPTRISNKDIIRIKGFELVKKHISFHGYTDFRVAIKAAEGSTAGIALLKPVADYPESYSTKLFEYMAMELPVITSNFPLYQNVIEKVNCGYCIDPNSPEVLADKLLWLVQNPVEANVMGKNGKKAAIEQYNWTGEMNKLLLFYEKLEK